MPRPLVMASSIHLENKFCLVWIFLMSKYEILEVGQLFKKEKVLTAFLDSFSYMLYIPCETMNMQI